MAESSQQSLKGDRALSINDEDKLGFRDVASRIAVSLVDRATEDGLVVGLEGAWGSGKSSLLFLISDELQKLPEDRKPTIIKFRPWLIGNRDALIAALFQEISLHLNQVASDAGHTIKGSKDKAKEASRALRSFMNGLSRTGSLVEFVGKASGLGLVEMAGEGVKALGDVTEGENTPPSLAESKDKLAQSLRELGHRFIVTIDDVDRLEPAEVIEVLRLVRSVIDLPNMIYLLCYDSSILSHSIRRAAGVKNGSSYLEKIVQLTVMVPKPEPLQLRQWFSEELRLIASTKNEDELARLEIVIDYEGGRQLRTPRSVVRALDAMRFFWPPLAQVEADLADLVWLQLIKDGSPKLYRWIEEYCALAAVVSLKTARADKAEQDQMLADLFSAIDPACFDHRIYRHYFSAQLPGMKVDYSEDGKKLKIFCSVSEDDRDKSIRDKRLSSPDHYRLYFALAAPSHVLKQNEFSTLWAAAEVSAESLGRELLIINMVSASGTLTKADLFLERLKGGIYETLSPVQCENFLVAFAQVMDQAYRMRPFDLFWVGTLWSRAQRLIPLLLPRCEGSRREEIIRSIFENGAAIGWLTSILRQETFAHGRYGERQRPDSEWLFTNAQLDIIASIMITRYRAMPMRDILVIPNPVSLLFAWRQAGDEKGPCHLVKESITSDEGLVDVLENMTSTVKSSARGDVKIINRSNIKEFMDAEEARQRIEDLIEHPSLGARAKILAKRFEEGDRF